MVAQQSVRVLNDVASGGMPEPLPRHPVILLLITNFDIGGAERVYIATAKTLASRGWHVVAACLQRRSGRVADELAGTPVEVHDLGMTSKLDLLVIARLARLLTNKHVDVVYTFLIHSHLIGRLAARLTNVPVVLSSQQTASWESRGQQLVNRLTSRWCSAIVAVSNSVAQYLMTDVGIPREKLVTIYNSIDVDRFPQRKGLLADSSRIIIGTVARLNPEKDYGTLLEAFRRVRSRYPTASLLVAGDGPERARLERLVDSLGLGDSVQFLGHLEDVRPLLAQLDVYVQSSHVEGLSVAVLEALATGLPVVATRVGGNVEAVVDNVCGLLVEPQNPGAFADALCYVLENPSRARQMGLAAREHVSRLFSNQAAMEQMQTLIDRLRMLRSPRTT
jgi:glycosyltransferase involved in cell wall biosynthesis